VSSRGVLVTGAGARVGRALALALGRKGWRVAVHYRHSEQDALAVVDQICADGGFAAAVQADLTDRSAVDALIPSAIAVIGPVHGLINNASHFEDDRLHDLDHDLWDTHMDAHLRAPVFLAKAFAAHLPKGDGGAIINLIDQRVRKPNPKFFSYYLSKAALNCATVTMAQALAPRVRVNAIAPGPTLRNARQSEADFDAQVSATLLGTGSPVREIVDAACYLLEAKAVTGQTLVVDGGQHLLWQTADVQGVGE
jgi:NAD(P)-dependent dehydrogenase (short-subunit alcohol dehydrogenase family)